MKLTILFVPLNASGHINASIGLAMKLHELGHRIVFALDKAWKGKTNFEEIIYNELPDDGENFEAAQFWGAFAKEQAVYMGKSPEEALQFSINGIRAFIKIAKYSDSQMKNIIDTVKPNVIVQDNYVCYPTLVKSEVPIIPFYSANPLTAIEDQKLPPGYSGCPVKDNSKWNDFRELKKNGCMEMWTDFSQWVSSLNAPQLEPMKFQYESKHLNLYLFPEDIDYTDICPLNSNWFRIDCFDYSSMVTKEVFEIPTHIKNGEGKLIYLSMGSFGSGNVGLMKRITGLLSKTPHRFIVSKGPYGDEYELPENMCGDKYLPQLAVLQMVDLAIIHGGNNSFLECLYFGKPVIVLPLFGDQYDNGQRVKELNIGAAHLPYDVTSEQLLNDINRLTTDGEINEKLARISKNLQKSKSLHKAAKRIEEIGQQHLKQSIV